MPTRYPVSTRNHLTVGLTGLAMALTLGGVVACSQATKDKTADAASAVASDVSSVAADVSANVSSMSASHEENKTQDFVTKATVANMFEIETSKAAIKTSTNKDVLAFAKMMVKDHTAAGTKMKAAVGKTTGVTAPIALDDDHQKKLDDLKAKTGSDFDKAYASLQKDAHDQAVDLFSDYSKNGKDAALQTFATDTLPTLQAHKDAVAKLNP